MNQQDVLLVQDLSQAVTFFLSGSGSGSVTLANCLEKLSACGALSGATTVYRYNGFSGTKLKLKNGSQLEVYFAPLFTGESVVQIQYAEPGSLLKITYCYFDVEGRPLNQSAVLDRSILFVDLTQMETSCPVFNHLYNTLSYEYQQAATGHAKPRRISCYEGILRQFVKEPGALARPLGVHVLWQDPAYVGLREQVKENALDQSLTYMERLQAWALLRQEFSKTVRTKKRCHMLPFWGYQFPLLWRLWLQNFQLFWMRPFVNLKGLLYRFTVVKVLWFFSTVRKNLGYSVALAIYGPFTYFFITQPMNPHAMEAVGKVRSGYLATVGFLEGLWHPHSDGARGSRDAAHGTGGGVESAPSQGSVTPSPLVAAATPSAPKGGDPSSASSSAPVSKDRQPLGHQLVLGQQPQFGSFFVSTEFSSVQNQTWSERMSRFKDLQIAYEANLRFSERMGRLEQMETQLNFSLIAESAYRELERYLAQVQELADGVKSIPAANLNPDHRRMLGNYFESEIRRTHAFELYIWDKLVRYMLDHRYIVLDSDNEQKRFDTYFGRAFSFLEEVTTSLAGRYRSFPMPAEYERVKELSKAFGSLRKETTVTLGTSDPGSGLSERLRKNLYLGGQTDFFSSQELRQSLKRQWEILYLIQNKAQEASNFGLQMYTWSVRNAVWCIESLHSSKRRELGLWQHMLLPTDAGNPGRRQGARNEIVTKIEPLYEGLFHILTLEYVSIRTELREHLPADIEAVQREDVIKLWQAFFTERDKVTKLAFFKDGQF